MAGDESRETSPKMQTQGEQGSLWEVPPEVSGFYNRLISSTAGELFGLWRYLYSQMREQTPVNALVEGVKSLHTSGKIGVLDVYMGRKLVHVKQLSDEEIEARIRAYVTREERRRHRKNRIVNGEIQTPNMGNANISWFLLGLTMSDFVIVRNGEVQKISFEGIWNVKFWLINVRKGGCIRVQDLEAEQSNLPAFWPLLINLPPGLGLRSYRYPHFVVLSQSDVDKGSSRLFLPSDKNPEPVPVPFILMRADYNDPDNSGVYVAGKGAKQVFVQGSALHHQDPYIEEISSSIAHALGSVLAPTSTN